MKAKLLFVGVLALVAALSWSEATADFGGTIRNSTGVESTGSAGLAQSDRVTAWLRVQGPRTTFLLRGLYSFSVSEGEVSHLADVDRLSLTTAVAGDGKPLSRFEVSMGRRPVTDHTGLVVNQYLDGLDLSMSYPAATVSVSLGSTLLPNKASAPVVLSRADAVDFANADVFLGSPRLVGLLEIVFPSVLRQRVTVSLAMQEDLRALLLGGGATGPFADRAGIIDEGTTVQDPSRGGLVDTQYAGLGIRGNITGGLFYNGFFTINTGRTLSYVTGDSAQGSYEYTPVLASAGGVGLTLYAEKVLGSVAGLRFMLSTGDSWAERTSANEGSLSATPGLFLPVTGRPLSAVFAPTLGNIAFVEASYSIRPLAAAGSELLANLQFGLTGLVFIRPVAGPISVTLPNTASTSAYLGSEFDLSVAFRPFSDLAVEASGGLFLPNSAAGGPFAGSSPWWRMDVAASLSL